MPIKNIGVLAFAGAAVAAGHGHQHSRLHAYGTGSSSSAAAAIPTGLPACWGTCFQKAGVSSPDALCDNEDASNCIKEACATADVASYEAWLKKQCSGAPYPSGPSNGTAVGPTGTGYSTLPSGYSTSVCTETSTLIYQTTTAYSTYLITHTLSASAPGGYGSASSDVPVSPVTESAPAGGPGGYGSGAPSGAPSSTPNSPIGGGEGEECSEVTVTTTERTTVTVTAGEGSGPSSEAPAPPSSYAAPSSPAEPSAPASTPAEEPSSYVSEAGGPPTSYAAPSSYEAPSAPASSAPAAPSSYAAPSAPASSTKPGKPHQSSPPTYDTGFRGKRGIAYNDSSMAAPFVNSGKVGWASNWEGISKGFEHSDVTFIPTLHSGDSYWTGMWTEQAEAAISQGLPYLFGPNEPDIPSQANMLPGDCADFWREWMEPYAGRIGLVAPSVSSGVGSGIGIDWLDQFMGNCSDCTFNAVNQHWYNSEGNDLQNFQDTIDAAGKYGPVFVGEFGAIGDDTEISDFMGKAMSYMDDNDNVLGYAYFMAYPGLLLNGDALSATGETFCNGE